MLLTIGEDPALIEHLCDGLSQRGIETTRVDRAHATAERGNLFQAALDAHATGLILVEPLAFRGAPEPPRPDDALLGAVLSATHAPGVTSLLLVTPRKDDDEGLRKLRRDGVPYIVLRPAPLFQILPRGVERSLRERKVLIPPDAAASASDAIPVCALLEAVVAAIEGSTPQGKVVDVSVSPERSLTEVLARSGAKPQLVQGWRSRLGRWFGQAIARVDGADIVIDGVEAPAEARVQRPAVEAAAATGA